MSMDKYNNMVFVLPEDDANRQMVNGFFLHNGIKERAVCSLPPAKGWPGVKAEFEDVYVNKLRQYPKWHIVLLVDFDEQDDRYSKMCEIIPDDLRDRVFVIGVWSTPEKMTAATGKSKEVIGTLLAQDCADGKIDLWNHDLLKHNEKELERMIEKLKPILFQQDELN